MNFTPTTFLDQSRKARAAQTAWADVPVSERLRCVRKFRNLLAERVQELCQAVAEDIPRDADEVLATDVMPTADACRFLEKRAKGLLKPQKMGDTPVWLFGSKTKVFRRPWGIVGIIGTWNYPIFLNAVQIIQAVTAGNAVLWKPSELTPKTAGKTAEAFRDAGFPPDLLQVLPATREAGPQLLDADIDHVVFTGSDVVGKKIAIKCAERLLPSTLELSGCDAMVVRADANLPLAAKAAWYGITLNQGQTCISVRRIFVLSSQAAEFAEELKKTVIDRAPRPLALAGAATQAKALLDDALGKGAKLLLPDSPVFDAGTVPAASAIVLTNVDPSMRFCNEAAFAPFAGVIPYADDADLLAKERQCPFALGSSVFTSDRADAERLGAKMQAGMVTINDVIVGTAHPATPFGGRNQSGWGETQGADGLLAMTVPQSVTWRGDKFRPHYAPSNGGWKPGLKKMMQGMLAWKHAGRFGQRVGGFFKMLKGAMGK